MPYALLDDQFYDHPKVLGLLEHDDGLAAVGLWTLALGWAKRHADPKEPENAGHLPASFPRRIGGNTELASLLVRVGLWRAVSDGWVIHDFAHWQQLEAWAERSAKARAAVKVRWDAKRKTDAARNGGVRWPDTVYYMTWPGSEPGLVKIGNAQDVEARRRGLTWNGQEPELLAAEPATGGRYELEGARQKQFAHLRVIPSDGPADGRREVYRLTPELDEFMALLRRTHPGWQSQTSPEESEPSTINSAFSQQTPYGRNTTVDTSVDTDVIPTSPHLQNQDLEKTLRVFSSSSSPKNNGLDGHVFPGPRRPPLNAPKAEWVSWATAQGVESAVSARSTKVHLAELADGKITVVQLAELAEAARDEPGTRDDVDRLCQHLADRIEEQKGARPHIGKLWRQSARYLLDIDGYQEDKIHAAIDWCQDDEFWRPNILSMSKLREKYLTLRAAATRRGGTGGTSTTNDRVRQGLELAARYAAEENRELE